MFVAIRRWRAAGGRRRPILLSTLVSLILVVAVVAGVVLTTHKAKADTIATATWDLYSLTSSPGNPIGPSSISLGVNDQAWDSNMLDANFPGLLNQAGVQIMRYPGGSTADNFHWYNQSVQYHTDSGVVGSGDLGPNDCSDCGVNFDQFMSVAQQAGSQAMVTLNYGTGSVYEAEAWLAYADEGQFGLGNCLLGYCVSYSGADGTNGHHYGIKYWEVGNEVYGDGTFGTGGSHWELNNNPVGPLNYATAVNQYNQALKGMDPSVKIGAVLTAPSNWPDGVAIPSGVSVNTSVPRTWNDQVLATACNSIDFVDVHWYPQAPAGSGNGHEDDAQLLASPQDGAKTDTGASRTQGIAYMVSQLRQKINRWCGAHASQVQIMVTETNSVYSNPGRQTTSMVNALFEDDNILTWLENGVANVDWWAGHNSPFDGSTTNQATGAPLYGSYNFGDYGLLSRGLTSAAGVQEPPAETPFPTYYGMQMLSHMLTNTPGWQAPYFGEIWTNTAADSQLSAHVVVQTSQYDDQLGGVSYNANIMLINKDPNNQYDVTVNLLQAGQGGACSWNWVNNSPSLAYMYEASNPTSISQSSVTPSGNSFSVAVPPYSVFVIPVSGGCAA